MLRSLLFTLLILCSLMGNSQTYLEVFGNIHIEKDPSLAARMDYRIIDSLKFQPLIQVIRNDNKEFQLKTTFQYVLKKGEYVHFIRVFPFWMNMDLTSPTRDYVTPFGIEYEINWNKYNKWFITLGNDFYKFKPFPYIKINYKVANINLTPQNK